MKYLSCASITPHVQSANTSRIQPLPTFSYYGPSHRHSPVDDSNSCLIGFPASTLPFTWNLCSTQKDSFRNEIFNSSTQNPLMACERSPGWNSRYLGPPPFFFHSFQPLLFPCWSSRWEPYPCVGFFTSHSPSLEGHQLRCSHGLLPHLLQIFAGTLPSQRSTMTIP